MQLNRFNLRVYGLHVNDFGEVLVTDEVRNGYRMTKFPGGGLEFGEGLEECLVREWQEELSVEIELLDLFYINDFLQVSRFNPADQLLSVYYRVRPLSAYPTEFKQRPFDFGGEAKDAQVFRWLPTQSLDPESFTFPIDRIVAGMLRK